MSFPARIDTARRGSNVRVESVARAHAYRESFRTRRCLVIVDGFFEWQRRDKTKQPFFLRRDGIWDRKAACIEPSTEGAVPDKTARKTRV
jgi:putative SOS response-associated peptidase YedK